MNNTQAPGQAAPAALPTMLAQQNGATPPAQVGPLSQLGVDRLKQLFMQTMAGRTSVPPLSILAAITSAAKHLRMRQALMGQAAQQQAAQQPGTVRDEVLAQAPPQGGIQTLASGGPVQHFAEGGAPWYMRGSKDYDDARRFGIDLSPYDSPAERAEKFRKLAAMREWENTPKGEIPTAPTIGQRVRPPAYPADESRPGPQALERAVRTAAAAPAGVAALPAAPGRAAPAGGPAPGSLEALLMRQAQGNLPEIAALEKEAADNARRHREMLERMQGVSPEMAAARKRYEETLRGLYEPQRKAAEEARAATKQGLLSSPEALLRLAAAASGKKRFGEALGATAGAAGEVLGERRKRAEQLEGEYRTLEAQRQLALAQAQRADAEGDEKRKQEALLKVQEIDNNLLNTRRELFKTRTTTQQQGIAGLTGLMSARAQQAQANRPTEFQQRLELYKRDPKTYEAMFGSKEAAQFARVQQVVASDPKLKALASSPMPDAQAQYEAHYRKLIATLAPELLVGAGTTGGGATADALKIVRGGGQ